MTKLTYMGRRLGTGAKLIYAYVYTDQGDNASAMYFKRTLKPAAKIGSIIEVEEPTPGSFLRNTSKIIDHYNNSDLVVTEWEAIDKADANIYYRRQEEKKANRNHITPLDQHVRQLRLSMSGMSRAQRAAFLAWLIEELR